MGVKEALTGNSLQRVPWEYPKILYAMKQEGHGKVVYTNQN